MNRNRILIIAALIVVVLGFVAIMPIVPPPPPRITNIISLQDVSLCASNCIYADPSLSGIILVNGTVPLATLHLSINGTDEGTITGPNATTTYATNLLHTSYAFVFRTQPNNPAMPIMAGKTYTITVEARFQDSSTGTVSVTLVASSGQPQVTFTIVLRSDPTQGCITIARTGPNCAYNGTTEVQWRPGDYEMAAYPNLGYRFVSWNASGGVFVPNPTTMITTVIVIGSGTLQANFSVITSTSSLQPQNLQPTTIRNQDLKCSDAKSRAALQRTIQSTLERKSERRTFRTHMGIRYTID